MVVVSYNRLWGLLHDRKMKKYELKKAAKISGYNIAKLTNDENVTVDTLARICLALNCSFDDVIEIKGNVIPERHHHKQ